MYSFIYQTIYQNTLKNPKANLKTKNRNVSSVYSRCTHACVVYMCVCVLEMRHRVGRSYNIDQDPYSQKHFIGWGTDRVSLIRPLWSIKFQSLVKGKTYRGWAPILCCCSSSTKHIQINKISQSRQGDCSWSFEIVALAHSVGWSREECISVWVGLNTHHLRLGWGAYNLTELCWHWYVCA